jgi:hypothetical protein
MVKWKVNALITVVFLENTNKEDPIFKTMARTMVTPTDMAII